MNIIPTFSFIDDILVDKYIISKLKLTTLPNRTITPLYDITTYVCMRIVLMHIIINRLKVLSF